MARALPSHRLLTSDAVINMKRKQQQDKTDKGKSKQKRKEEREDKKQEKKGQRRVEGKRIRKRLKHL